MKMNYMRLISLLRPQSICKVQAARYISQHPFKFNEIQNKWRENDGISKQYQLIYKAPMENTLKYTSAYLTFSTVAVAGMGVYYALFVYNTVDWNTPIVIGDNIVIANSAVECFTYLGAFVAFHIAVNLVLSRYVIRIYQNADNYIAIYRGHLFNSIKKHEFNKKDVKKLRKSLIITWSDAVYALGSRRGILLENYFKTPEYFNNLVSKSEVSSKNK